MSTNRYRTNAPIICPTQRDLTDCAATKGRRPLWVENPDQLCGILEASSKIGEWVACDAFAVGYDRLREAVHRVWLKAQWDHHANFRFWVVDGPLRDQTLRRGGRPSEMLPFILSRSAIDLRYTPSFDEEFEARELVSAVEDSYLAGVQETCQHIVKLQPDDVILLLRKAVKEEIFMALLQPVDGVPTPGAKYIVRVRSIEGHSALDVALERDFRLAAVALRDLGCKSEEFDFGQLIQPSFQPMLSRLLDPWSPFPFEPKISASRITQAGKAEILRKLFDCRIDVDFLGTDYPLAEACSTGDMRMIHIVLDRMSATGVHPFRDYRLGQFFLNKIMTTDYSVSPPVVVEGRLINVAIDPVVVPILHRLCDAVIEEGQRVAIQLDTLRRAANFASTTDGLTKKILQLIDVAQVDNPDELLNFFIDFDPQNALAGEITRLGLERVGSNGGPNVDRKTFEFLERMIRVGPHAIPMMSAALKLAVQRDYVPLTYRVEGQTLLMVATRYPPNYPALAALIDATGSSTRDNVINQVDNSGNNVLVRVVVQVCQQHATHAPQLDVYGDIVERLLMDKCAFEVFTPNFTATLFVMSTRQDLGEVAYELLPTQGHAGEVTPLVLSCTPNLLALMGNRHVLKVRQGRPTVSLDSRINPAPQLVAGQITRTVASELSLALLAKIAAYTPVGSLSALMRSCATWYYASLLNPVWAHRLQLSAAPDSTAAEPTFLESAYALCRKEVVGGMRLQYLTPRALCERRL